MRNNTRRAIGVLSATLLPLTGIVMLAGPAAAQTLACGSVVTASTTLDSNIGPCTGDGLIIQGSGITLDLGGHTVTGANTPATETSGIHLVNATGVTVQNGTVTGFDAGVFIEGGSGNIVRGVTARDNINDKINLPRSDVQCDLGDGITTLDSNNNRINGNTTVHNGPFSGISLVGNSDGNLVRGNNVADNNVVDPNSNCGRRVEDIGIRIEGPGANGNRVEGNRVTNSALAGISLAGFVAHPRPPEQATAPNTDNSILGNTVTLTGQATSSQDPNADGIAILQQGPATVVSPAFRNTISGNTSNNNFRDGIFVSANSANNTINGNTVNNNARDGIHLSGPRTSTTNGTTTVAAPGANNNTLVSNRGSGNGQFDGFDGNRNCDNNHWSGNRFVKVNQLCVAAGGGTGTVPAGTVPPQF